MENRKMFTVIWDTENAIDGFDAETLEEAKDMAFDILYGWMIEERAGWESDEPNDEQIESWNAMINDCSVWVDKHDPLHEDNPDYDEEYYWTPSEDDLEFIGWKEMPF